VSLPVAFWRWAMAGGLAVNLSTFVLLLALVMQVQALAGFLVSHAIALPYNILAGVGVWRSAARHAGSRGWADAARAGAVIWLAALSLI
jgi:hypothetical protein